MGEIMRFSSVYQGQPSTGSAGADRASETPESRLAGLGLTLPKAPGAVANYAPWVISGNMVYMSGQLPWIDGNLLFKGKIGRELTPEQGYEACKLSTINCIAQLKSALGDLARVKRVVRLEGTLNVAPGFTGHPTALNGASDLVNAAFGPVVGLHTRMIYTNPEMPLDCACLIVLWAEI
jgi:enamine deaminase RidA (YjgF/YER057c/UK114 family)